MSMRSVVAAALLLIASLASAQSTAPVITSISPETAIAGTGSFVLTVNGTSFINGAVVRVNGSNRATTFVSATRLTATVQTGDVTNPGTLAVTVFSNGRVSNSVTLTVLPNDPRIDSLSPDTVPISTTSLTIRVTGQNFASTAKARVNGVDRVTTFVSATTLDFQLLPADVATARTLTITVANPSSRISNSVSLTVRSGALTPEITALDPATVLSGGAAFTLKITGRNFDRLGVVKFDTVQRTPTFIDSQHLEVQVLATQIATQRQISVTVVNPGNLVSNAFVLSVDNEPTPAITTITPESLTVNTRSLTITVDGTNFVSGAKVRVGGADRTTTFVSATRLTASLLTTDVSSARELAITVKNPGTDGRESAPKALFVVAANAPTITSIAPTSITVGTTAVRIVLTGTNYQTGDAVLVNGAPRETLFISATQMSATLLDTDTASAGDLLVTVRKSTGATSAPFTLRVIDAATPFIESFDPATAVAGGAAYTLTINGRNFAPDSVVRLGDRTATSRYVSASQLSVDVLASDIATPGTIPVVVTNAGGASSAPANLSVVLIVPEIASLDPSSVPAGDPGFTLNLAGTNFSPTSVINFDGVPQADTRYNASTGALSLIVPASQLVTPRAVQVTVSDRGATSALKILVIASPSITSVTPNVIVGGSNDVVITVDGANFVFGSRVSFKGGERPTTFVSASQLTATLPFTALREPGDYGVAVVNTSEAVSGPFTITITSPGAPAIFSVSPSTVFSGTTTQLVTVTGANFLTGARIRINGTPRETTFVSTTELGLFLTADDMRNPGTLAFSVVSAAGEVSNTVNLTVLPRGQTGGRRRAVGSD